MELSGDPKFGEVEVEATAEELAALADAVVAGEGHLTFSAGVLAAIEVAATDGPGVLVSVDGERRVLVIGGDAAGRQVLAEVLRDIASTTDGGHTHVDHCPGHPWLAEGSLPLIVDNPLGGMPRRQLR
ncbi:Imm32 family immunity protein [Kitasatospora sp. CB01950]|uniref:Imm32 family immunity protein n=1 Tax=Kitasatospora sp. CB01950 TaxID=1703930 RepID=UPI00093FB944|nr:hypothetical protein [Kitasatospora sp. CB01950]OKJ13797.1 hypothetical protein AMK19_10345 [Kitasatospora sp. CB01950]